MEITEKIKERFCKDNNLNIKIFKEPYFTQRLYLYDKQFDTIKKWNIFLSEISDFKTEEEYFSYYNKTKESVMDFIKSNPIYDEFLNVNMQKYAVNTYNIPSNNIFHQQNNGQTFISIDLKKGCYSALRFFNKALVDNTNSYEEFLGKFTDKKHILDSKYIRQVIFGNCKADRQTTIEKYMMSLIMEPLQKLGLNFVSYCNDEIVIKYDEKAKEKFEDIKNIVYNVTKANDFDVHFEVFEIERVKKSDAYIKKFLDGKKPEIKCANHIIMPFILRQLQNLPPHQNDFIVVENKTIAMLLEIPELEIKNQKLEDFLSFTSLDKIEKAAETKEER